MSFLKDMTLNESVFHKNINSGPSIVTYDLSMQLSIYICPINGLSNIRGVLVIFIVWSE